jgi:type I restriction enzyme S subunit
MVPKVRFKGFTNEWEQRKLGKVYGKIGNAFVGTATPYYVDKENGHFYLESNNVKDGHINRNNEIFINDEFYKKQQNKWLHTGDIVMVQSGHVGHSAVIPKELNNIAAHALIMFRYPVEKVEPNFINYQFQTIQSKKKIENITTGNTIKHILASDLRNFSVSIPVYSEQEKIGSFFKQLDNTITLQQHKLDQLNTLKKGLLQKMFADKKHPKPELRFKSFHDNWINHKAGDFMIERNQKATIDDDFPLKAFIANKGVADKGERYDRSAITNDASNKMYKRTLFNDFIYSSNNLETGSIGLNKYGNASISPVYSIFYFKNKESADFFGRILVRKEFINSMIRYRQGVVYGQWRIKEKDFLNISISVPSLEEQEKIGSLLDKLDETINVNSKLLNQLKVLKKSLLQTMFI